MLTPTRMSPGDRIARRSLLAGGAAGAVRLAMPRPAAAAPVAGEGAPLDLGWLTPGCDRVLVVLAAARGTTTAVMTAWQRDAAQGWRRALGPWPVRVGGEGFAAPGTKREGDRRSPTGVFPLPFAFGSGPRPDGLRVPWRPLAMPFAVWVDDPRSRYYNELVDTRHIPRGAAGASNPLRTYTLAAAVGYNARRTPGLGSAIFLHADRATRPWAAWV